MRMTHSHYHKASQVWFNLDTCETCGAEISAPNACHVPLRDWPKLKAMGVVEYDNGLPFVSEGWYNEDTDMECCDNC